MKKSKKITIKINGKKIKCKKGKTILEVAIENDIYIPALCHHSDLDIKSNCRLCLVEIKGKDGLFTSCSTKVEPGMEIITDSLKIKRARKINLELIFSQHTKECDDCVLSFNCELLDMAEKYQVRQTRFADRKSDFPIYKFGPSLIFDSSKCINCRNCVDVCPVDFLEIKKDDDLFQVFPTKDKDKDCIYCGQCIVHCPAGGFEAVGEFEKVEDPLKQKGKKVIFQFAPSLRTSIGEEFGVYGAAIPNKLAAAIKKLGVDKVFDVSVGADFTTVEEAKEFWERLESGKDLPMFTSCCPSWVKFVEFYYPQLISNLTTVRSPHIILGGLIKTYWAKKENIDPSDISVVSIMPCVSKKYEICRDELKIKGNKPVDFVLTTRELAYLFHKHNINIRKVKPQNLDDPLGLATGAGVIYGSTGGVMESALRTVYNKKTGKKIENINFKDIKDINRAKKANLSINNKKINVAFVSGIKNAKKLVEQVIENPKLYDYIEVMSCPGGCIGGGGQPIPVNDNIRDKRTKGLYDIDKKTKIRLAHKNPIIKKVYNDFLKSKNKKHLVCHTSYFQKDKEVKFD